MHLYGIYNLEGQLLFEGNAKECENKFNVPSTSLYWYSRNDMTLYKSYKVKINGVWQKKEEERPLPKPMKEQRLEYLIRHLDRYGNVYVNPKWKPDTYIEELRKKGYKVKVKVYERLVGEGKKKVKEIDYVFVKE